MIVYYKLFDLLKKKGMKKTDLKKVISGNTLAKLGKNETISSNVIEKICEFLECQPGDIMEVGRLYLFKYESWSDSEKYYCRAGSPFDALSMFLDNYPFRDNEEIIFRQVPAIENQSFNDEFSLDGRKRS